MPYQNKDIKGIKMSTEQKPVFFITYGNNLLGCYSKIDANSYTEGRAIAYKGTDSGKYAFFYEGQDELDRQIAKGYLQREIELQPMIC
jgi:hypothetical protein